MGFFDGIRSKMESQISAQQPNQNQYLTGNPSTQPNANTSWMSGETARQAPTSNATQGTPVQQNPSPIGTAVNAASSGVANPNNWTRDQYRDNWMSAGPMTWQGMQDWLSKNGGQLLSGNGTVRTPFGEDLDMGFNARGAQAGNGMIQPFWTIPGGGSNSGGNVNPGGQQMPQQANSMFSPQLMQQIFQQMIGNPNLRQTQNNPQGASQYFKSGMGNAQDQAPNMDISSLINPIGNRGYGAGINNGNENTGFTGGVLARMNSPELQDYANRIRTGEGMSFFGGGVIDPATGMRRNPRAGEPQ